METSSLQDGGRGRHLWLDLGREMRGGRRHQAQYRWCDSLVAVIGKIRASKNLGALTVTRHALAGGRALSTKYEGTLMVLSRMYGERSLDKLTRDSALAKLPPHHSPQPDPA